MPEPTSTMPSIKDLYEATSEKPFTSSRGRFVLVHLNDSEVFGPFPSEQAAYAWAAQVPNAMFHSQEEYEHADGNGDFWVAEMQDPGTQVRGDWRGQGPDPRGQ